MTSNNDAGSIDIEKELEELPGLIAYHEEQVENVLLEIDSAKCEKDKELSETLMKYKDQQTIVQKAMYKQTLSEQNKKIVELKGKLAKERVALNAAKNRFQSIRKIASMRIEEMKHI